MGADDLTAVDRDQVQRAELLLYQLGSLPTLDRLAVRMLDLATGESVPIERLVAIGRLDPGLSCRLISMCRRGHLQRSNPCTTIEAAADRLGLEAVRATMLAVPVAGPDGPPAGGETAPGGERSTWVERWWRHSLTVGLICETLARNTSPAAPIDPGVAYLAGLVHGVGQLALHSVLPGRFTRAWRLAQDSDVTIDEACQRLIGLTTRTAGRKLAEHWRLPHLLVDVLWLQGQPAATLPDLPHRPLIQLVTFAEALASGRAGTALPTEADAPDPADPARLLGLDPAVIEHAVETAETTLSRDLSAQEIDVPCPPPALLGAVSRANLALGRMHEQNHDRAGRADRRAATLRAITAFHDASAPGGSFVSMFGKVVHSAREIFGPGFYAMLYQARVSEPWQFMQFSGGGRMVRSEVITPPAGSTAVGDLADHVQVSMQALAMLPWLIDYVGDARDVRDVRLLPLRCGWGVNAVLLHDVRIDGIQDRVQMEALSRTWAAAIAAAAHHAGARNLGEKLAESNRALLVTRDALNRRRHLASLGEIAAGAAHEMNNPLTVISGRAQLLAIRLEDEGYRSMAEQIVEQSHRLSDMISSLRSFAEPTAPQCESVDLRELLESQVQALYRDHGDGVCAKVTVIQPVPPVALDRFQFGRAIMELLRNAAESEGSRDIEVRVQIDPLDDRLQVQIVDDGKGLTRHSLAHAFDPFFSAKSAGRQPGLGLAHARRIVEAHGGSITLENGPACGAIATLRMADWRAGAGEPRQAA